MFKMRRFTSFCLSFSFVIMSFTGIILFIAPKGRVANWTNWELFGLQKGHYQDLHSVFMVIFLVFGIIHIYYNWKPLVSYFKNKTKSFSILNKEFVASLLVSIILCAGTMLYLPPINNFLIFGDTIKASWEKKVKKAPYQHAELATLKEFSRQLSLDLNDIVRKLQSNDIIIVDSDDTIQEVAKKNKKSPADIFEIIKK